MGEWKINDKNEMMKESFSENNSKLFTNLDENIEINFIIICESYDNNES